VNIMQNQLRLDDLLARDVAVHWFEGVALVQLICRQLRAAAAANSGFPQAADILIGPGGSITITGRAGGNAVAGAAHVLALTLSDDAPVRLRLAVSQATASDTGYADLAEFSDALTYFERPNPESIVESFRQRAMIAAPRASTRPARIDIVSDIPKQVVPPPSAPRRPLSRLAVIGAVSAGAACAAVWLIGGNIAQVAAPEVAIAENAQGEVPGRAPRANAVTNTAGVVKPKAINRATASSEPMLPMRPLELTAAPLLLVTAESASYSYPDESSISITPPIAASAEGAATVAPGSAETDEPFDRIYTRADPDVTLPINVYPKFPSQPTTGSVWGRTVLELTIATDGLVERVRMLTAPRNIHEFMLLSAAKAWRFEPARISGRAVRFRQTIALTQAP
jgi:outer membrane biosynthesis protein TonB